MLSGKAVEGSDSDRTAKGMLRVALLYLSCQSLVFTFALTGFALDGSVGSTLGLVALLAGCGSTAFVATVWVSCRRSLALSGMMLWALGLAAAAFAAAWAGSAAAFAALDGISLGVFWVGRHAFETGGTLGIFKDRYLHRIAGIGQALSLVLPGLVGFCGSRWGFEAATALVVAALAAAAVPAARTLSSRVGGDAGGFSRPVSRRAVLFWVVDAGFWSVRVAGFALVAAEAVRVAGGGGLGLLGWTETGGALASVAVSAFLSKRMVASHRGAAALWAAGGISATWVIAAVSGSALPLLALTLSKAAFQPTLDATVNAVAQQLAQDCGKADPIVRMAQRDAVMMCARLGMLGLLAAAGTGAEQMAWLGAVFSLALGLSVFALARPAAEAVAA